MQTYPQSGEADRELKAYIYQQLMDIQPFLIPDSQVAVMVQQALTEATKMRPDVNLQDAKSRRKKSAPKEFLITLVATTADGRIEAEGQAADIYEAFGKAKQQMVRRLEQWQSMTVDSAERAVAIQTALHGGITIH